MQGIRARTPGNDGLHVLGCAGAATSKRGPNARSDSHSSHPLGARCGRARVVVVGPGPARRFAAGLAQAIAVKERNAERLLDKPGIVGVGVGVDKAGRPVIEVYKEKHDVAGVPASLEGVDVDSVVTGIIEARAPTDRFPRPVPIGVSSGLAGVATGTLGVRVTDGTNVYALSNNHVFAGINSASIGDPIIQPGDVDGGSDPADRIGTLYAYQAINFDGCDNTMDAALALTTAANTGTGTPADGYGTPSNVTATASIGQAVQKYGRTTGLQAGTVDATNVTVDVCYLLLFEFCLQEARFVNQISVSPGAFSAPGDSGSLIVTQGGNQPVALLFAGGEGLTIGHPIDPVLQRFGVTIDGQPPGDGPPGAPTASPRSRATGASPSPGTRPPSTAAPRSPATASTAVRAPGAEIFLESTGTGTSFVDSTAQNGTTYYYKVSAENALGEGPLSNEAQATPSDLVAPVQPLPTLDDFNRPDELPVPAGWSGAVGVNGSAEGCLKVVSNQLASNKTTTCTGWRSNTQYGPDTEVWTKIGVLPGANNHIRLKARLQQVGTTGYDGYMLRTNRAHRAGRGGARADRQRRLRPAVDAQPGARCRGHAAAPRQGLDDRGLAQRRDDVVANRNDERHDLRRPGLRRHRPPRPDRPPRRLRGPRRELDAARRAHRPVRARGRRERDPLLDRADLRRRLRAHRLPHLSRYEPGQRELPPERGHGPAPRHRPHERADLLLQGVRGERDR